MRSKVLAARSAVQGGRSTVIANGHTVGLSELFAGAEAGTLFAAESRELTDRKLWIANTRRRGAVVVADGAVEALWQRGKSLLPSGILEVVGDFDAGDLIGVEDLGRGAAAVREREGYCRPVAVQAVVRPPPGGGHVVGLSRRAWYVLRESGHDAMR